MTKIRYLLAAFLLAIAPAHAQKISDMTAGTALTGAELFESVQGGNTRKITADQIKTFTSAGSVAVGSITGLGTGVATALAVNVGSAGAPVVLNGAGGTPSSMTGTNIVGIPPAGVTGTAAILGANTFTAKQTYTPSAANQEIAYSSGYSVTGSSSTNGIDINGTFNTTGIPVLLRLSVDPIAYGAGAAVLDVQANAGTLFDVQPQGQVRVNMSGNATTPILIIGGTNTSGFSEAFNALYLHANGGPRQAWIAGYSIVNRDDVFRWASGTIDSSVGDTGISRPSAGVVAVGNGTASDFSGTLKLATLQGGTSLTLNNAGSGSLTIGSNAVTPASSGTRYLCISTAGVVTSSASACSGT